MSDSTFDASRNYKRVIYRPDRDLLNSELNEAQDIEAHERRLPLDKILAQGTIISGLQGTVDGDDVTIADGVVYLDGCAVNVPGTALSLPTPGEHLIYLDVFRREVTASDDTSLANPLTGEPTAEREKWIATLQTRDTTSDPLPDGAISRTVVLVYVFNRDTGELRPYVGSSLQGGDILSALADHAGHGGLDRHPAAKEGSAGFMTPEQLNALLSVEAAIPGKADGADVTAVSDALTAHRTSADHDARYYTESETDSRFAPIGHVGSAGGAHAVANGISPGFMSPSDKGQLTDHESRIDAVEMALPEKADVADVTAVTNALSTHTTSADHDSRYYTEGESDSRFAAKSHVGSGGPAHSSATTTVAGFMSTGDKTKLDDHESRLGTVESVLPGKADDADVTVLSNSLVAHKGSADHDSRYYTEVESDARFTPVSHIGSAGAAHGLATPIRDGFISQELCWLLTGLIKWNGIYDYGNDGMQSPGYGVIGAGNGMSWRGKCDSNSTHVLATNLRATGSPITATFEFYHMSGTVTMQTGPRVQLASPESYPPRIPGGKVYLVDLYPDSFSCLVINVTGSGDVGFDLSILPGDDRQICSEMDPDAAGKSVVA